MTKAIRLIGLALCFLLVYSLNLNAAVVNGLKCQGDTVNISDEAKEKVLNVLSDLKRSIGMRAPRFDAECSPDSSCGPQQPPIDLALLQQIKCAICQIKEILCDVDHESTWESLIDVLVCPHGNKQDLPECYADAFAVLAQALTQILKLIGCPECENEMDIFGALCYITSKIDLLETACDCCSLVQVIDNKVDDLESQLDVVVSNESEMMITLEQLDVLEKSCKAVSAEIGSGGQAVDAALVGKLKTLDAINAEKLTIIQWLKLIYAKLAVK